MSKRAQQKREAREAKRREQEDKVLLGWMAKFPPLAPADPDRAVNIYACDTCGRPTVTRDVNKGVTPFTLGCRGDADLFDADGMPLEIEYVADPADLSILETLDNDELLTLAHTLATDDVHGTGALFVALAHSDPERSTLVQDRFAEHATGEQLQRFTVAVLEAAADAQVRCPGTGYSTMYQLPPEEDTPWAIVELLAAPPWEWYRPTELDEIRGLENDLLHHIQMGGLVLRKREGATGAAPTPEDLKDTAGPQGRLARFFKGLMGQ